MNLTKNVAHVPCDSPFRIIPFEGLQITYPPAVITDAIALVQAPVELTPANLLAELDRLKHRAVAVAASADVVNRGHSRSPMKGLERGHEICRVNVVAHLLAAIAEHGVALSSDRAAHQVGEEAMELRPGVIRAGQAAAAKARSRQFKVAAVLLNEQVSGRLGDAEQRVRRFVDRHGGVDSAVVAVVGGQLQAHLKLDERQMVGK